MKILLVVLSCCSLVGMQKEVRSYHLSQLPESLVQNSTDKQEVRNKLIEYVKKMDAACLDDSKYEIRFYNTFRGQGFEVFAKMPPEVTQDIEHVIIEEIKKDQ